MKSNKPTLQKKLSSKRIKKPNLILYPLLGKLFQIGYYKKLGVHITKKIDIKKVEAPFILVSNHASRLDYLFTGGPFLPRRMNYIAGYNEFFRSHLKGVFSILQIIPKRNFVSDIYTIRQAIRILKNKGIVVLFPEGMNSIGGANQPVALGSGKFLKHCKVPVLYSKISGAYLTSPKFDLKERKGKIEVVIDKLFDPADLEKLDEEEIQDILNEKLYNNDYEWNKTARIKYKAENGIAHNMHQLLYKCPKCLKEFEMVGENDHLICRACGNEVKVNEYYDLIPTDGSISKEDPKKWYDWERECVKEELKDPNFILKEHVVLGMIPEYHYLKNQKTSEFVGEGELSIDRSGLTYKGTKNNEEFTLHIDSLNLPTYGMCTDASRFYTFDNGVFYEFYPTKPSVIKWLFTTEEIHRLIGGKWQDFKINR